MMRVVQGLYLAGVFGLAASLGSQSPNTSSSGSPETGVQVTGCLAKQSGAYTLTNVATVKPWVQPGTRPARPVAPVRIPKTISDATTFKLEGDSDLDRRVGYKVEVLGTASTVAAPSARGTAGVTGTTKPTDTVGIDSPRERDASVPRLDVQSVREISSTCRER